MGDSALPKLTAQQIGAAFDCVAEESSAYSDEKLESGIRSEASILILLNWKDDEWQVFLTLRSIELRRHGGEVSFPGGKRETLDRTFEETALREAHEETGLVPSDVEVVRVLRSFVTKFRILIHPVVGILRNADFEPKPNAAEVERCFWVPLSSFLRTDFHEYVQVGERIRMHKFEIADEVIFGLTAFFCILSAMLIYNRFPEFTLIERGAPLPTTRPPTEAVAEIFRQSATIDREFDLTSKSGREAYVKAVINSKL